MGRICQVCNHHKRLEIDRELISGHAVSRIARKYGVTDDSLYHHRNEHLTRQLATSNSIKREIESGDLVKVITGAIEEIREVAQCAKTIYNRNIEKGKDRTALAALNTNLAAINSKKGIVELLAKMLVAAKQIEFQERSVKRAELAKIKSEENRKWIASLSNEEIQALDHTVSARCKAIYGTDDPVEIMEKMGEHMEEDDDSWPRVHDEERGWE